MEHHSSIVEVLNDHFGTDLTNVDKLFLDQFEESWLADGELADQAQNNSLDNFRLVLDNKFLQTIITRVDANDEILSGYSTTRTSARRWESSICARTMNDCRSAHKRRTKQNCYRGRPYP